MSETKSSGSSMRVTDTQIDAAADALRQYEQGQKKSLVFWNLLPNATKNKWRDRVRVVLTAALTGRDGEEPQASPAWKEIDSAPKDGSVVDIWVPGEFQGRYPDCYWGLPDHCCGEAGQYCDSDWHREEAGWVCSVLNTKLDDPTHWMPCPEPPSTSSEAKLSGSPTPIRNR